MEDFKSTFNSLISQVRKTASFSVTTFVLFLYRSLLDEHMKCSCTLGAKPEVTYEHCINYMVLPAVILFLLTLWMDGQFQRALRMTCRCRCDLWGRLLGILIKAAAIGLLWVVFVLFDGDWYVCYQRTERPCRYITDNATYQEVETQRETGFKKESLVFGSHMVLVLLVGNYFLTAVPWSDICNILAAILRCAGNYCNSCCSSFLPTCPCNCNCSCCNDTCKIIPHYRALVEDTIWEETEILIEKVLKRSAQERVVCEIRKLKDSSTDAIQNTTKQEGDTTKQRGVGSTITNTTTQGGGAESSSTTLPDDIVIILDRIDYNKIAGLNSTIISSLMPANP